MPKGPHVAAEKQTSGNCHGCYYDLARPTGWSPAVAALLVRTGGGQQVKAPALQVDPNLVARNMGKIEDDVPVLYKRLRYPFGISKSALFAVGSPHTWPGLLAALTWLVELLNYEEKAVRRSNASLTMPLTLQLDTPELCPRLPIFLNVACWTQGGPHRSSRRGANQLPDCACGAAARQEVARAEGFDGRLRPESEFFEYVARAYRCFLAGDDPGAEAVDEEQAAAFEARSAETVERNQRLEQARLLPCVLRADENAV